MVLIGFIIMGVGTVLYAVRTKQLFYVKISNPPKHRWYEAWFMVGGMVWFTTAMIWENW